MQAAEAASRRGFRCGRQGGARVEETAALASGGRVAGGWRVKGAAATPAQAAPQVSWDRAARLCAAALQGGSGPHRRSLEGEVAIGTWGGEGHEERPLCSSVHVFQGHLMVGLGLSLDTSDPQGTRGSLCSPRGLRHLSGRGCV